MRNSCLITCVLAAVICTFLTPSVVKAGESAAGAPAVHAWRAWLQAHPLPSADQDRVEEAILAD
jgi:hypothetical protein